MKKVQVNIAPKDWGHLITKYYPSSKRLTFADFTAGTVNIDTDVTGSITKCKGSIKYNQTALAAPLKDQFEAIFSDGARHLLAVQSGEIKYSSGDTIFNTVVNGTGFSSGANFEFATTQDRVYGGNASDDPIVYDRATSYGGVVYTAPRVRDMGAQAPGSAAVAGAPTAGGNVPNGAHTYKITFVYYDFEESNGSPVSGAQTAGAGNNTIPLSSIPIGGYGVTARKIYRDNNDGLYLHIATLADNTTTVFSDTINVGLTPTEIPEFNNAPPSFGLVTLWLDKLWFAKVPGDPYTLFYSESGQPDIVRPENQILCNQEDPITAFVVYFDRLIVFNRRSMGQILGKTADSFRYAAIPSSVGCVDNRTLQIRVVEGVPILIWLSDRGFYTYDGNAINYISDEIEDLVNFNIQQALQQRGANSQSTQTQFQGGTASPGIDLTSVPGSITTKGYANGSSAVGTNPRRNFDDQTDWESGLTQTNIVTQDGTNQLKAPTRAEFAVADGDLTTLINDAGVLKIPLSTDFTGESCGGGSAIIGVTGQGVALKFSPTRTGQITGLSFALANSGPLTIYTDSGGFPGVSLGATPNLIAGVSYWMVKISTGTLAVPAGPTGSGFPSGDSKYAFFNGSTWSLISDLVPAASYTFCSSSIPKSGQWLSAIYDTLASNISTTLNITQVGTFPAGSLCSGAYSSSGVLTIEGSNDSLFSGGAEVSEIVNNLNGNQNLTISGKRYWRVRVSLSTTDDRITPSSTGLILKFATTGTWISPTIDVTADVTALNSLTIVDSQPAGTSIVYTIATSADDITYPDGFVTFGTQVNRRYVRIRAILTTTSDNITTPAVSSIILRWTLVSNLISSAIDTAVAPPAGWDTFLASFQDNGGTVQFQMRSGASLIALAAASFFNVTPGAIPSLVTPLQFTQWKVILTSSDEDVPSVDSVTVQWLISQVDSIRPASIFVDGRYYVALAEAEQSVNNILLWVDLNGKWRRRDGLSVSTFSYFFNRPYLGLATIGTVRKFLEGFMDDTNNIAVDVRTKALDFSTTQYDDHSDRVKLVGEVVLEGRGTGAAYQLQYSVDEGQTYYFFRTNDGSTTYTSPADNKNFYVRFRPEWDVNPIAGRTIIYRLTNNDGNEVEIHSFKPLAFVREQPPVITG